MTRPDPAKIVDPVTRDPVPSLVDTIQEAVRLGKPYTIEPELVQNTEETSVRPIIKATISVTLSNPVTLTTVL